MSSEQRSPYRTWVPFDYRTLAEVRNCNSVPRGLCACAGQQHRDFCELNPAPDETT